MTKAAGKSTPSTQQYLDIAEIKEDCVVMKDGTLRAVIIVSSINFALKAETEQQALIASYMDFLNSFEFPFQIVIQSRKLSLERYLTKLVDLEKVQKNELLRTQMVAYRNYVKELIDIGDIMTKRFFVVIPYLTYLGKRKSFFARLREVFTPGKVVNISKKNFETFKTDLDIRSGQAISHLNSMGLNASRLDTQSLIELYYSVYNPISSQSQPLEDVSQIQAES
jgi:hypothetical protein